ncbi:MAG: gamma-glutamylcyclotransferase family protein [Solirubrobacterales bacterium]
MRRAGVFGYGSLVSVASASQTIGRPVEIAAVARLEGWTRAWTLGRNQARSEKTFARPDGSRPRFCLGLNVEPSERPTAPNGALIELSEVELERLDLREIRYHRVEVTEALELDGEHGFDAIYTYSARPEHHHPEPPEDAIVVASYPATIEAAFAELGPEQLELYRRTTAPIPVEVTAATLVRDRIPAGNPRDW